MIDITHLGANREVLSDIITNLRPVVGGALAPATRGGVRCCEERERERDKGDRAMRETEKRGYK